LNDIECILFTERITRDEIEILNERNFFTSQISLKEKERRKNDVRRHWRRKVDLESEVSLGQEEYSYP
jgi:hypothetical protein